MALPAAMNAAALANCVHTTDVSDTIVVRWSSAAVPLGTYWTGQVLHKTPANATTGAIGFLRVDYGDFGRSVIFPPPAGTASVHTVTTSAAADPYGDGFARANGGRPQIMDPFNATTWGYLLEAAHEAGYRQQLTVFMREFRTLFKVPTTGRLEKRLVEEHRINDLLLILTAWTQHAQTVHREGRRWDTDPELGVVDSVVASLAVYHVKANGGSVTALHAYLEKDGGGLRGRISEGVRLALEKKGDAQRKADKELGLIA